MTPWFLIQSGAGDATFNMALDEALLEAMPRLSQPILRFYDWTDPAASFGYFQRYSDVERLTPLRPLVRRPTAGGIVPHDADWTYSIAIPPNDEWYALKAFESYRRAHEWIQAAFARLNISTELAPVRHRSEPGQCFAGYEQFDLLWHGRKIAGAAQRRTKQGLLIQGSVQSGGLLGPADAWRQSMCDVAVEQRSVRWAPGQPDATLLARAEELTQKKYSQAAYNQKR